MLMIKHNAKAIDLLLRATLNFSVRYVIYKKGDGEVATLCLYFL